MVSTRDNSATTEIRNQAEHDAAAVEYLNTLDLAYRAVDALGGTGASEAYNAALDAATAAIANIGGMDAHDRKHKGYQTAKPEDDEGPYFRAYMFQPGRVLSAADVGDIQEVLRQHNDLIGEQTDIDHNARQSTLMEIGGAELVEAVNAKQSARIDKIVAKALAQIRAQTTAIEGAQS